MGKGGPRFSPGCTCCSGCLTFADGFRRSNQDTIGPHWDVTGGTFEIYNGYAQTSSDNVVAIHGRTQRDGENAHLTRLRFKVTQPGDQIRNIVSYVNDNNYLFSELELESDNCGMLRLYRKAGGSATQIGHNIPISNVIQNSLCDLHTCYVDGSLSAEVKMVSSALNTDHIIQADVIGNGLQYGFGFGTLANSGMIEYFSHSVPSGYAPRCTPCFTEECATAYGPTGDDFDCLFETTGGPWIPTGTIGIIASGVGTCIYKRTYDAYQARIYCDVGAINITYTNPYNLRVVADYVDENNYHYAEIYSSGTGLENKITRIGKRSGGVDTILAQNNKNIYDCDYTFAASTLLGLCIDENTIYGRGGWCVLPAETTPHNGTKCGFAVTTLSSTNYVTFALPQFVDHILYKDIGLDRVNECPDCDRCGCNGEASSSYKVVIDNLGPACCNEFNGTYILTSDGTGMMNEAFDTSCGYSYKRSNPCYDSNYFMDETAIISLSTGSSSSASTLTVNIHETFYPIIYAQWNKGYSSVGVPCNQLLDESIPWFAGSCSGVSSTCLVTVL